MSGCQRGNACRGNAKKCIGVTLLTREHVFYKDLEAGLRVVVVGTSLNGGRGSVIATL